MTRAARLCIFWGTLAGAFILLWVSVAFQWPLTAWIVGGLYALIAVLLVIRFVRRPRDLGNPQTRHPAASDAYSDLYLGRTSPTFFSKDVASTVQIGEPPRHDG